MRVAGLMSGAAVAMLLAGTGAAEAQVWKGGYVSAVGGYGFQKQDDSETVRFDKDLDGSFSETILTAAGVNAFSPGFCGGAALTSIPSGGCAEDDDKADVGVRAGYDWQAGMFVVGALGEFSSAKVTDSVAAFSTTPAFYTLTRELNWLGSVRGRAGVAVGMVLIYGTAGATRSSIDYAFATSNTANTFTQAAEEGTWGYQAGGGVEFKLARVFSIGAEYLFTSLDDRDRYTVRAQGPAAATNPFILTNSAGTDFQRTDPFEFQTVRATVSLRF